MKSYKKLVLFLFFISLIVAADGRKYRGPTYLERPLFNYSVIKNNLPYGNYWLLRSSGKVTQVLISKKWKHLTLYTDRDNTKASPIFVSAYIRGPAAPHRHIKGKQIRQDDFNLLVEEILEKGDKHETSTFRYPGLHDFLAAAKKKLVPVSKEGTAYLITLPANSRMSRSKLAIDWRTLSFSTRSYFNRDSHIYAENVQYPIYIEETRDPTVIRLIKSYSARLYRLK
ncbi:MAG: hypothetical protein GY754_35290 [bacterium]|nr:hypothetical protein [bacterium]